MKNLNQKQSDLERAFGTDNLNHPIEEKEGRFYIKMGNPGFNTQANNASGYPTSEKAMQAFLKHGGAIPTQRIKNRYFSVKNEGHEIYCEDISKYGGIKSLSYKQTALRKLRLIQEAMPKGLWTITIEQGLADGSYQVYDPENDKMIDSLS